MDFNKIKEMGLEYAEKGKNAALDLAAKMGAAELDRKSVV